jgi:hypothetical protein
MTEGGLVSKLSQTLHVICTLCFLGSLLASLVCALHAADETARARALVEKMAAKVEIYGPSAGVKPKPTGEFEELRYISTSFIENEGAWVSAVLLGFAVILDGIRQWLRWLFAAAGQKVEVGSLWRNPTQLYFR